jgi:hypothetical protein
MKKVLIFLFCISATVFTQSTYKFMNVDVSPRAAALGGSFTSANDDADVIFYNPAGISYLTSFPVSFSYTKYLVDINFASLAASKEIPGIGRVAAGIKYVNYGTFTGADELGNRTGDFGAGEVDFEVAYANFLDENFSYGVGAGFVYSKISEYSSTGFTFNTGLNYSIPSERINIAVSMMHAGSQFSQYIDAKENLPLDLSVGLSKRLLYIPLKFYLDFHHLNIESGSLGNRLSKFTFGGEFGLGKALKLRLGFDNEKRNELKIGNFAGLAGFSVGLGLVVKGYNVNYGYSSWGQIGGLHRFGVNMAIE